VVAWNVYGSRASKELFDIDACPGYEEHLDTYDWGAMALAMGQKWTSFIGLGEMAPQC
jgi:hypothetical protein